MLAILVPARRQVKAKELERGSNSQQGFLNLLTDYVTRM